VSLPVLALEGIVILGAYLLGAIPFGWILGRTRGDLDLRSVGSGNIGATNVARSVGAWAGVLTLGLDVGKGVAAVWGAGRLLGQPGAAIVAGMAAIAGHVFPVYLAFKGGKGVATGLGVFLVLEPVATFCSGGVFLVAVMLTRRVSAGSILAAACLPLFLLLRGTALELTLAGLLSSSLIIYRHSDNIRRLLAGTEPKLGTGR